MRLPVNPAIGGTVASRYERDIVIRGPDKVKDKPNRVTIDETSSVTE